MTPDAPGARHSVDTRRAHVARAAAAMGAPAGGVSAPRREDVGAWFERLRGVMFPALLGGGASGGASTENMTALLDGLEAMLKAAIGVAEPYAHDPKDRASSIALGFLDLLPSLRELVRMDAAAAYEGDPAARQPEEVVLCYPGLEATTAYRAANALLRMGAPILPRMITEYAHSRTGIDIHPAAEIGRSFFIDHGTGVVIGETAVIGDRVTLYQGVTLGAKNFPKDGEGRVIRGIKRHPTVGNGVTIYAGAVVLGGDTVVGDGSLVGANVHLTRSVPAGHVVRQHKGELQVLPIPGAAG